MRRGHLGPSPARITWVSGVGGSSSRENGTSSATHRAHSVSRLGLPVPDSSWDSVDLAIPARRATSVSDSPARCRSRRSEAAMTSSGGPLVFVISVHPFGLTNDG